MAKSSSDRAVLETRILQLREQIQDLCVLEKSLVEEILPVCEHTSVEEYVWEHDNGYGRQSWHTGERCRVCRKRRSWPGHGVWSSE